MRIASRFGRIIGALTLGVALGACSLVQVGYNSAPELAYWWLDDYVDFSEAQSALVREDLARLHDWHRSTELARYAELLEQAALRVADPMTPAQACEWVAKARGRLQAMGERAEPAFVSTALALTPAQLQHLARRLERKDAEFRKDWVDLGPAQLPDKRFKLIGERLERLYGPLEEAQQAVLRQQLQASRFDGPRALSERRLRQQALLRTLAQLQRPDLSLAEARRLMRAALQRAQLVPGEGLQGQQQLLLEEGCATFAAVHQLSAPAQRQHAARRLRAWQRDVTELAARR